MAKPEIELTFPAEETMTVYESTFIFEGKVSNTSKLVINGLEVPINTDGSFKHSIELLSKKGNNYFLIEAISDTQKPHK